MHRVTIQPDSRSVEVRSGERLLSAAWKAGVGIKSVCGGRGKCGSCVVEVDARPSDAITLALRQDRPIYVAAAVWAQVEDMTWFLRKAEQQDDAEPPAGDPPPASPT